MSARWWTRLALLSAISGFVLSGPPPDYQSPGEPPIKLTTALAPTSSETSEIAAREIDNNADETVTRLSTQIEDEPELAGPP